jgi:hypothetical protein
VIPNAFMFAVIVNFGCLTFVAESVGVFIDHNYKTGGIAANNRWMVLPDTCFALFIWPDSKLKTSVTNISALANRFCSKLSL